MLIIAIVVLALDRIDRDPLVLHERRGHVVLRGQRVRGAEDDLRAARLERLHEVRRLRRHVQAGRDAHALEGLILLEALLDHIEDRHRLIRPFDAQMARVGQVQIFDIMWCRHRRLRYRDS